jgi:subfamily B ATP-binding cassette protein MsbA
VTFDEVAFSYVSSEQVLDGVSFSVERGEFVGFVGQSGAGKSTIVSLLARLYEPDSGEIRADEVPIEEYDVIEWRKHVSIVRQDPFLFNDTLRANITVGNREATQADVERVAEIACVTEFLGDLPDGYDTELGDDGVRLSGGQRQRVAIARALLKEADLLVLDEATSDLDTHLEEEVHRAIERMERDYAMIAIAHRLSTVTGADQIYTMESGRIVESGAHKELVEVGGQYAGLYASQS